MINYDASIEATINKSATASKEIYNQVQNAAENGSIDWLNGVRTVSSEDAEAFNYIEAYLDSVDRTDLLVVVTA
jgi:hypothetical protein